MILMAEVAQGGHNKATSLKCMICVSFQALQQATCKKHPCPVHCTFAKSYICGDPTTKATVKHQYSKNQLFIFQQLTKAAQTQYRDTSVAQGACCENRSFHCNRKYGFSYSKDFGS